MSLNFPPGFIRPFEAYHEKTDNFWKNLNHYGQRIRDLFDFAIALCQIVELSDRLKGIESLKARETAGVFSKAGSTLNAVRTLAAIDNILSGRLFYDFSKKEFKDPLTIITGIGLAAGRFLSTTVFFHSLGLYDLKGARKGLGYGILGAYTFALVTNEISSITSFIDVCNERYSEKLFEKKYGPKYAHAKKLSKLACWEYEHRWKVVKQGSGLVADSLSLLECSCDIVDIFGKDSMGLGLACSCISLLRASVDVLQDYLFSTDLPPLSDPAV